MTVAALYSAAKASPVEHEVVNGQRTGHTRVRQFTTNYARAARSGVWPDMATREMWMVAFR